MFLLSRGEANGIPLAHEPIYLDDIAADCARALRVLARERGIDVRTCGDAEVSWSGDSGLLRQMLSNLVENAIRHAKPDGIVSVTVRKATDGVTIRVNDDGAGIPSDQQQRIFERFVRLDPHSRRRRARPAHRAMDCRGTRWHPRARNDRRDRKLFHRHSSGVTLSSSGHLHTAMIARDEQARRAAGSSHAVELLVRSLVVFALGMCGACATTGQVPTRETVDSSLRARTNAGIRVEGTEPLPPNVVIDDGVTSQEAVAIALWNSPSFQATLADLGIARADVVEAGLLRNPIFSLLFP